MACLSWALARLILGGMRNPLEGSRVVILPMVAAFIMVAWDFSQDPLWSTVLHLWIWRQGGAYFGVPVSNFFGWYLTVYVSYQLFALYLRGRSTNRDPLPSSYWHQAVLFYAISAAGNILLAIPRSGLSVVSDPTGAHWKLSGEIALNLILRRGRHRIILASAPAVLAAAWTRNHCILVGHFLQERRKSLATILAQHVDRRFAHRLRPVGLFTTSRS
jgi:hypothetical protein